MHFPPSDRKKSNPSHEFAGDSKNELTIPRFDDIETNLRPNQSNDLFSAFCLKAAYSVTMNIFRKILFFFKSFVKAELSYVFTINLFTRAENCTEK